MCLHGFMGRATDWDDFSKFFSRANPGWQIVMLELPGHGDAVKGFRCPDAQEFAAMLVDLVKGEGWERAALCGYSLGGRLALNAALSHPHVFPIFIGVSTAAGISEESVRVARCASDALLVERLRGLPGDAEFAGFLSEWWRLPIFESPLRDAPGMHKFLTSRIGHRPADLAECLWQWSPGRMLPEWDRLGAYSGAALLVSGAVDTKYSEMALRMASVFANGEAVVLGGGGHRVPAELPEKLARTVSDFLAVKRVLPDAPGFVVSSACGTNLRKS